MFELVVVVVVALLAVLLATGLYVLASTRSTSREALLRTSRECRPDRASRGPVDGVGGDDGGSDDDAGKCR